MINNFIKKLFPTNIDYRNVIFIPLFFSFYILLKVFGESTYFLENFNGRPISIATSEGLDIGLRVRLYYKAIIFGTILLLLFTRAAIILKKFIIEEEYLVFNGLSLAGFCLLFFKLFGSDVSFSLHFIFALMIVISSGLIFHKSSRSDHANFPTHYLWSILVSVACYFLFWQIMLFMHIKPVLSLPVFLVLFGVPLYLLFTGKYLLSHRILNSSRPLIFLPLLSFVCIEGYMINNQHGIYFTPGFIYVCGLLLIIFSAFRQYYKSEFLNEDKPALDILFSKWIPWLIAGLFCIAFYSPVVNPDIDFFEDANHILPLQQFFSFGKIPFMDSFSSHALSDFGFGILYSLLNGADPMGVFVYGFLMGVIILIVLYYFIYKISGNGFLAIWITLAYPYTVFLLPAYFNLVPLAALTFLLIYEKQTVARYIIFFSTLFFMIAWRIDLGSSTLVAGFAGLFFLINFMPDFEVKWKKLFQGLAVIFCFLIVLFLIMLSISGSHIFISISDALAYMSSFQSYGLKDLSNVHDMKYYILYFVFPGVILLIVAHSMYNLVRQQFDKKNTLFALSLVFLGLFYFSNLQRGLVRHTLAENWDTALTSYAFFIIASAVFLHTRFMNTYIRFLIFFIAGTVVVTAYSFTVPDQHTTNNLNYLAEKLSNPAELNITRSKISRVKQDASQHMLYDEFSNWMNKNYPGKSTFLDFSNTPMLYYYANKIVPNYFLQIPHTAHNEYLQKRFLEDLHDYDIPVVVYSTVPETFWDNLDGIPNTLRHYRISEYIFKNYTPAYIINNHSVWLDRKLGAQKSDKEIQSVQFSNMIRNDLTENDQHQLFAVKENGWLGYVFNSPLRYNGHKIYMTAEVISSGDSQIEFSYASSANNIKDSKHTVLNLHEGKNTLFIMATPAANEKDISAIRIQIPLGILLNQSEIKIYSGEHFKDYYSEQFVNNALKWIPFVWGTYDDNFIKGKISSQQKLVNSLLVINAGETKKINFKPEINKSTGNYILINANGTTSKETLMTLMYGEGEDKAGAFSFLLKGDTVAHNYLIRISSQYNWHSRNCSEIRLINGDNKVEINNLEILKGD